MPIPDVACEEATPFVVQLRLERREIRPAVIEDTDYVRVHIK